MGNITGKTTIPSTGVNGYLAGNDSIDQVDLALTDSLTVLVDDGNAAAITDVDPTYNFSRNILFVLADDSPVPDAAITITIPATKRGQFVVKNTTSFDATITISGQAETADSVAAGTSSVFSSDGSNVRVAGSQGTTTFTGLSDTPGSYAGDSLKYLRVNSGETAVEATAVAPGAAVAVTPPYRGALIGKASNQSLTSSTEATVEWGGTIVFDTDSFYNDANDEFVIPAGITRVRLHTNIRYGFDEGNRYVTFWKNDSTAFLGNGRFQFTQETSIETNVTIHASTADILVTGGDTFKVRAYQASGGDVDVLTTDATWFAIEALETTENIFPPEQIEFFQHGSPTTSDVLFQKVANRAFTVEDGFAGSGAYAITASAGGAVDFDVDRNGTKIGTISFADGVNTATFATEASQQYVFAIGDRLTVESPADIEGMADVSFTLFGWRS